MSSKKKDPKADVEMNGEEEKKQGASDNYDPINKLFGIEMEMTTSCVESEAEPQ